MGWEVRSGFHISTVGTIPETGTVDIVTIAHLNGQTYQYPTEPLPADRLSAWGGYSLDMHGQPALDPSHPRDPVWRVFEDDGTPHHPIELDRIRVRAAGSHLFAELIALPIPDRPIRVGIFGWDQRMPPRIPTADEVEKAIRGLELLGLVRDLEAARLRRRPRLEDLEDATAEQGWLTLTEEAIKLHQEHGMTWKIAADRIGVSNKTLNRWRDRRTTLLDR